MEERINKGIKVVGDSKKVKMVSRWQKRTWQIKMRFEMSRQEGDG